jgi:hypothetical protein
VQLLTFSSSPELESQEKFLRDIRESVDRDTAQSSNSAAKGGDVKDAYHESEAHLIPLSAYRDWNPAQLPQPQLARFTQPQTPAATSDGFTSISDFYRPSPSLYDRILDIGDEGVEVTNNVNSTAVQHSLTTPDTDTASWLEDTASTASNDTAADPDTYTADDDDAASDDSINAEPATSPRARREPGAIADFF